MSGMYWVTLTVSGKFSVQEYFFPSQYLCPAKLMIVKYVVQNDMYCIFRLRPDQIFSFTWNPFAAKSVYWVAAADENDKEYFLDIPIEMAPWTAYNVTCGHKVRQGLSKLLCVR